MMPNRILPIRDGYLLGTALALRPCMQYCSRGRSKQVGTESWATGFLTGAPGVYFFDTDLRSKSVSSYTRYVDFRRDGIFYGPLFEAMVDRERRVSPGQGKHTDQWIQRPDSFKLTALWVQGCHWRNLPVGECIISRG